MSPATKIGSLRALDVGRAIQLERMQAERREWEAIVLRVNGASLIEIADKLGFGKSRKRVRTAIRAVDLPKGKRYLCDRGQPFTRGSGIALYKTLNQTGGDFARLVSTPMLPMRERRIIIWFTKRQCNMVPIEASACVDLRNRIARRLLGQDGTRGRDSYDRREVLAALFPRFREEYKILGRSLRGIGTLLEDNSEASESDIAAFVIALAKDEVSGKTGTSCYRELIRWLPHLMPFIVAHRAAIAGAKNPHRVAFEILADTMGSPVSILRDAIEERVRPATPDKMRFILRSFPEFTQPKLPQRQERTEVIRGDRKKRGVAKDTPRRLQFMAAWYFLKRTTYALAKVLYPGKEQKSAEAAVRSVLRQHSQALNELKLQMDELKATDIVKAGL